MFIIILIFLFSIFLILAIASGAFIDNITNRHINRILKAHTCTVISIANTNKSFKYKQQVRLTWINFTTMNYSPARTTIFKEVTFNTAGNKKITSLVAVDNLFLLYNKIFFEIDLDIL